MFRNFIRSGAAIIAVLFILTAGFASLVIGKRYLAKQQEVIAQTTTHQQQHISKHVEYFNKETGLLLYYLKFSLVNAPRPLSGLSIGQRDVNPSVRSVNIRNLENQQYDTDLSNPSNLLLGNLDLGFVMIYLFPLIIIIFTYNIFSEEAEGGTWNMVRIQAVSPLKLLWHKLLHRAAVVYSLAIVLLLSAIIILQLPLNITLLAVACLLTLYLLFWFSLIYWIVSWRKSSGFNAICMLAAWILLTILTPAFVNSYISNTYPVPEALQTVLKQRQGYHEKWDMNKSVTMDKFYAHYPQFKKYQLKGEEFNWLWYYAMQQMGDDDAARYSKALEEKLRKREEISARIGMALPVLHTQLSLNDLAGSGMKDHLLFQDSVRNFHEKMKLRFYPEIFEERPVNSIDWSSLRVEYFTAPAGIRWGTLLLPLIVVCALLSGLAGYNLYRFRQEL
ncbi:MAG TPA: DUF3526 domain-containing protein [Chitinophaga sp.]|nr:DUF3526 domain-containing protein [Chitinophaga sp.]